MEDSRQWSIAIDQVLGRRQLNPVLLDIGASGPPRSSFDLLARHAIFVGFDPDLREIRELTTTPFYRALMVNEAVTVGEKAEIPFFLTRSPYCSSTLEPDLDALANYSFVDEFRVEQRTLVKATTLSAVLTQLQLDRVDWFKIDSQGTDLRLFNSLPPPVREGVLCVEVEPGLIDVYKGEDLFVDAHRSLTAQGFWLCDARVCGTARILQSSIEHLRRLQPWFDANLAAHRCPPTPGWVEGTYMRSIEHLARQRSPSNAYCLLWAFALLRCQWGFALDVALAYENTFGADETSGFMRAPVEAWLTRPVAAPHRGMVGALKSMLPGSVKRWVKGHLLPQVGVPAGNPGESGSRVE